MPNFFSRIAGLSPRVCAASRKLFAIVSATVSTAGLAMPVPSLSLPWASSRCRPFRRSIVREASPYLTPRFLLFPAPFAPGARFLGPKVKFLDVLGMHQAVAGIVHDDAPDLQYVAVVRGFQRHLGILLDEQDRHALLFVDA